MKLLKQIPAFAGMTIVRELIGRDDDNPAQAPIVFMDENTKRTGMYSPRGDWVGLLSVLGR